MTGCIVCGNEVSGAGIYCSNACRQRAYRSRRVDATAVADHSIPHAVDRFVGRLDDLVAVRKLLGQHQAVVITGPTGVGKTRLALEVARQRVLHGGKVRLVDLTEVADPDVPSSGVLVLDTCEHRVALSVRIAIEHPGLRILATSTVPLPGFVEHRLTGLSTPDPGSTAAECLGSEAVRLFLDRAPDLEPDDDTLIEAGRLCATLDGSPFAIELAARRLAVHTPAQLADGAAEDPLGFLPSGYRTAAPRQRGLRAAARWGYELLKPEAQAALRALALLPGGADAELAGVEPQLLETLAARSLAVSVGERYRLHEPVRRFAVEQLRAEGEFDAAVERLVGRFVEMGQPWFTTVLTPEADLLRWRVELKNLQCLVELLADSDDERRLLLAAMQSRVEETSVRSEPTLELLQRALERVPPDSPYRAPALECVVYLAADLGLLHIALPAATAALAEERRRDRPVTLARLLDVLAYTSYAADDLLTAVAYLRERTEIADRLDDPMARPSSLARMAWLLINLGDYAAAAVAAEEALVGYREHEGSLRAAPVMINLAIARLLTGDADVAKTLFCDTLRGAELELTSFTECLEGVAFVELTRGKVSRSAVLLGAAARLRESATLEGDRWWQERLDEAWAEVSARLPQADELVRSGRDLSREEAAAFALGGQVPSRRHPALAVLSQGQVDVIKLLTTGMTNRQIAEELELSERGVEARIRQIKEALHVRSRAQVAAWGVRWINAN